MTTCVRHLFKLTGTVETKQGVSSHLFFGHAHRPLCGNWLGISFSSLRGTNHQVGLNFSSEQIDYVDEPPEYAVVFADDDRIVIHSHAYPLI